MCKEQSTSGIERRRFRPYPQYKDSGIEWLGKIPGHWKVKPLKHVAPLAMDRIDGSELEIPYVGLEHVESRTGKMVHAAEYASSEEQVAEGLDTRFRSGDILFGKLRPYLAKVLLSSFDGRCSSELLVLRSQGEISPAFLAYQLLSPGFIAWINAMTYGTKMPRASPDQVISTPIAIPDADEQSAISAFLDHKTATIDALIAKKERLIELLQEKRTALITQAVTKGLDPNVPMKDSGIEWLGEIPAHWDVKRIKNIARLHTGGTPAGLLDEAFEAEGIPWVKPEQLQGDCGIVAPDRRLSYDAAKSLGIVIAGSSLVCGIGTVGKTGYAQFDVCTNQQINAITFGAKVINRYGQFMVVCLEQEFTRRANKVTIAICNKSEMGEAPVCILQVEEQRSIASFLDCETAKTDSLISRINDAIIRLREFRIALVSDAVTGKIDVRAYRADTA